MNPFWLVLIISLPTHHATGRMRVWRALKALGCGVLRDGVYLLPNRPGFQSLVGTQVEEIRAGGGIAHLLSLDCTDREQQREFETLFDRTDDYAKLDEAIRQTARELSSAEPGQLRRKAVRLRKDFEHLAALDFFPGPAQAQAASTLASLEQAVNARLAPDEPQAVHRAIHRLNRSGYRGRLWATRAKPWVDRLASAWLIRRFIDPDARFLWLSAPDQCPSQALGFDFDGAAFTHVGAQVTFEVLLTSFGLEDDAALSRIGGLVHYLDVGGIPAAEAAGLEALLKGLCQQFGEDDELLDEAAKLFDALHQAFSEPKDP